MKRRCPVCMRIVQPTTKGNVFRHTDSIGRDVCPMSGEPYDLTVSTATRRGQLVEMVA